MTSRRTPAEVVVLARNHTANTALVLAIVAALALGFAGFGVEQRMFDLDYAVTVLATGWAPNLALLAAILGVLALLAGLAVKPRGDFISALLALAIAGGTYGVAQRVRARELSTPPIHDVATDWTMPLMFSPSFAASGTEGANRIQPDPKVQAQPQDPNLTGTRVAEVNARTCRGAAPLVLTASSLAAYDKAHAALVRDGEMLATEEPETGRLEAVATTKYLKLVSDVVVRIKPAGSGARIDIRSISRTGIRDLGENCARVTRLRAMMAK